MATVPSLPFRAPRGSAWAKLNCVLGGDSATVPGTGCHGLIGLIVRKLFIKLGNSESTESPAELLLRRASVHVEPVTEKSDCGEGHRCMQDSRFVSDMAKRREPAGS